MPSLRAALVALLAAILLAPAAEAKPRKHESLARHSLRAPLTQEHFYFVMADRFANGDTGNDRGGIAGGRSAHGFDPSHRAYYHGGDLRGLISKLDYIKGMGTTAIWLTPSFKNRAVQGEGAGESAGYHGYWITDFTQIDPHLGTNADLRALIAGAHARGMKVFFDIITNHTADVIDYEGGQYLYRFKADAPYKDAQGNAFDDRQYAGTGNFPDLDLGSFPYTPFFHSAADAAVKFPDWLDDPTLYHNRGNAKFDGGESDTYGDFAGLDDLFTEHPRVVQGMIDIYKGWVRDFGVDGFRIDTVKHVNPEFWRAFVPELLATARAAGKKDFLMFGEVFSADQKFLSQFPTDQKLQSVLDFAFQDVARSFASKSAPTDQLRKLFVNDDWFTDADSNVYQSPTFLGNHDMGRIGFFIDQDNAGASDAERLARDKLAHRLMFLSRGMPVIYYGDEQGFTGTGGDQLARQDMFPSQTQEYWDDDSIGTTETPEDDNFDPSHPLYREIAALSRLTKRHEALRDGAQQHRFSSTAAGIYAFSRIDAERQREYVVALNNAETPQTAAVQTYSDRMHFKRLYGDGAKHARSGRDGKLSVTVPGLSAVVYRASGRVKRSHDAPDVDIPVLGGDDKVRSRFPVTTEVDGDSFYEVTYYVRTGGEWTLVGTDDNAPYRVVYDASKHAPGTKLTFLAVLRDNAGHTSTAQRTVEVDVPPPPPESLPKQTKAIVHYRRPNGDYDGWGLHLWGSALAPHEYPSEWFDENTPERFDDFGAVFELDLVNDLERVNFITHKDDDKDGGDRSFLPRTEPEIWLVQGDPEVYTEPPPDVP